MKTESEADATARSKHRGDASRIARRLCKPGARYLANLAGRLSSWTTALANNRQSDLALRPAASKPRQLQEPATPGIFAAYQAIDRLPDGRIVRLRAIQPGDRESLQQGFLQLSDASVRDRFFSVKRDLTPKELTYFTEVDFLHHVALVAELQDRERFRPAGVGRFVRSKAQPDHSEIALTVLDEFQGKGIGKTLLTRLIDCARELGVRHLDATVLPQNTRVSSMLRKTGLPIETTTADGIKTISLSL